MEDLYKLPISNSKKGSFNKQYATMISPFTSITATTESSFSSTKLGKLYELVVKHMKNRPMGTMK